MPVQIAASCMLLHTWLLLMTSHVVTVTSQGELPDDCEVILADNCFKDVALRLRCFDTPNAATCRGSNLRELCSSYDDALNCTASIVDTDCDSQFNLTTFHYWMSGLVSVKIRMCNTPHIFDGYTNPAFFQMRKFISCVENRAKVQHVVDLLRTKLDINECVNILTGISKCIYESSHLAKTFWSGRLRLVETFLMDLVREFFSKSKCMISLFGQDLQPPRRQEISQSIVVPLAIGFSLLLLVNVTAYVMLIKKKFIHVNMRRYNFSNLTN